VTESVAEVIVPLCAFAVGEQEYVLDVMRIRAIVRPPPVTGVPLTPDGVEGMVELRGEVVPVVDLRKRLSAPVIPLGPKARMLVVVVDGREVALLVDRVLEVMRIPRSAIRAAPPLLRRDGPRFYLGVCEAVVRGTTRLRLLLNLHALLGSSEAVPPLAGDKP
jgi:purine-binding chemotaxis protein CheW